MKRTKLVVNIDLEGAAFDGPEGSMELARILRDLAQKVEDCTSTQTLWDVNGNQVGFSRVETEDD